MPGYLRPDPDITLEPSYFDAVQKLRVSQARALIDTDFEYGLQASKWENLGLINNRPFSYPSSNIVGNITAISLPTDSSIVTVTTSIPHGLVAGQAISVQDTFLTIANGNVTIDSVTSLTFSYTARSANRGSIIAIFDPNKTAIYAGTEYTNAKIGTALLTTIQNLTIDSVNSPRAVTVTTRVPHGLSLGNEIAISGITGGTNPPNGSWSVATVLNANQFVYYPNSIPSGTFNFTNASVTVRPQAQFLHRPFDGGVIFGANASSNNQQAIRQTRRYFRYQSGKGIQMSSGTVLKPNLALESLRSSGKLVTVQTKEQHNLQPGSKITIFGAKETNYNGTFSVIEIISYDRFQYEAALTPQDPVASGEYGATVENWYGCSNRIGMFDSQNGMFFEFDGQKLYAVKRSSTYQISGRASVTQGSNTVSQQETSNPSFPTNFSNQLTPGDFIVIRGQSYRVETINSDTEMTITPSYRGASASFVTIAKTIDEKIEQSQWNIDTMDGNGPSGFSLNLTKMQMFYIDYSWYGAGFIRFGFRGVDGEVTYCHKIVNNNVNSEAYMRSGNLPARYESNTFQKVTNINPLFPFLNTQTTTLHVTSTEGFEPGSTTENPNRVGTLLIRSGSNYEYINYTGKTATTFTGLTRARAGTPLGRNVQIAVGSNKGLVQDNNGIQVGQRVIATFFPQNTYVSEIQGNNVTFNTAATAAGAFTNSPANTIFVPMGSSTALSFSPTPTQPVSVEPAFPTYSASLSHWGTSVIMDGDFDDDKSLLFSFGQTRRVVVPINRTVTTTVNSVVGQPTQISVSPANPNIVAGMTVTGNGIQQGTVVTNVALGIITLSLATTTTLTNVSATFEGGNSRALFSIRVAPSVDNSIAANFGRRDLVNRLQLILDSIGVISSTTNSNMLVTAILNGKPSSQIPWRNVVQDVPTFTNSSLAQIADYAGSNTVVLGGETTGAFYLQGTSAIDLSKIRDLGNSVLGGGGANSDTSIYPDGPDVLTIVVTNLNLESGGGGANSSVEVLGRIGWYEAQA